MSDLRPFEEARREATERYGARLSTQYGFISDTRKIPAIRMALARGLPTLSKEARCIRVHRGMQTEKQHGVSTRVVIKRRAFQSRLLASKTRFGKRLMFRPRLLPRGRRTVALMHERQTAGRRQPAATSSIDLSSSKKARHEDNQVSRSCNHRSISPAGHRRAMAGRWGPASMSAPLWRLHFSGCLPMPVEVSRAAFLLWRGTSRKSGVRSSYCVRGLPTTKAGTDDWLKNGKAQFLLQLVSNPFYA